MENTQSKNKRLGIEIPKDIHADIKIRAAKRGISITKYVMRAVIEQIKKEKLYE